MLALLAFDETEGSNQILHLSKGGQYKCKETAGIVQDGLPIL
jgi:hypothetical protein